MAQLDSKPKISSGCHPERSRFSGGVKDLPLNQLVARAKPYTFDPELHRVLCGDSFRSHRQRAPADLPINQSLRQRPVGSNGYRPRHPSGLVLERKLVQLFDQFGVGETSKIFGDIHEAHKDSQSCRNANSPLTCC
jgi:hypothetical protein